MMVTNRDVKSALLRKLGVTPQRLSQRVKKIKDGHGPMSTEDATYVIAHQQGLDLTKHLDPPVVDRVRSLVPKEQAKPSSAPAKKPVNHRKAPALIKIDPSLPRADALLSTTLASDAKKMADVYAKYYVLENSIRVVIKRILGKAHGKQWWQTKVGNDLRRKVADRMKKENQQPWHGKRGQHEIFYSDFGDLKRIVTKNWKDFKKLFPSQPWITQRLDELEHPRNVMAHHNPVSKDDLQRIDLYFNDWIALIDRRRALIP